MGMSPGKQGQDGEKYHQEHSMIVREREIVKDEFASETKFQDDLADRKKKAGKIVGKLEQAKKLTAADLNLLASPAMRLEYKRVLIERGHDPKKFADMFDILHTIASDEGVSDGNRIKAANAYIARAREVMGLAPDTDGDKAGTQNILVVQGDLIAGGQRNEDPVRTVPDAEGTD